MSYNDKNNLKSQFEFLNQILPVYGINTTADIDTEITSSDVDCEKLNKFIPDIQKLFKTSVMNLARSNYKFTHTNALPILKHLCIQARIPFDITKYQDYYTFAITKQNPFLQPEPINNISNSRVDKPIEYYLNLPTIRHDKPVKFQNSPLYSLLKWPSVAKMVDMEGWRDVYLTLLGNIKYKKCEYELHILERMDAHGIQCKLSRTSDFVDKVDCINLYDANGEFMSTEESFNISIGGIKKRFNVGDTINLPLMSTCFYEVFIEFDEQKNGIPLYAHVVLTCSIIDNSIRRTTSMKGWNGIGLF